MSGEPKIQDSNNTSTYHHKCRIPQRLLPVRQRQLPKSKAPIIEPASRPKSANRATDDVCDPMHTGTVPRLARPGKSPPVHKGTRNGKIYDVTPTKAGKQVITVPLNQKCGSKVTYRNKLSSNLPDQETINKCEELELQQDDFSDAAQTYDSINDIFCNFNDEESVTSQSEKMMQLKTRWQEKIVQFEAMKNDLNDRQNGILEVYASLRNTKQKLISMGQKADLPSTDDLRIMNVANMTPNQLLQLCAETKNRKDDIQLTKNALTIDMKRFNEMPLKLVSTCEQTIATKKELIDWFENLKNQEKGCTKSSLSKKINEFNAENEMLSSTLQCVKNEFLKEVNDFLRICWNERIGLQLRNEELTCEVSVLNSQNTDLKKQLYNTERQKSQINKIRIEELEKELKEEKMKKMTLRDRLSRAEGQIKDGEEHASLLEASLNEARTHTQTLERTVQQLHEKNQQLQKDFNDELNNLKECMKTNTIHLEEIVTAKESLQQEKDDLEKKLEELSKCYNDSLSNMKQELSKSIAEMIEAEKKCNNEIENKNKLQKTVESQCAHLLEYESRLRDTSNQLQEFEKISNELLNYKKDFERTKYELDQTFANLENHKKLNSEQSAIITKIENNLKMSYEIEKKLKNDIVYKEEYISTLEKKQVLLQQKSQEDESKTEMYEEQLTTLKCHLTKLQEHFIEFENLNELKDLVNQQSIKLAEMKRKNDEMNEEQQTKQNDLNHLMETIEKQEDLIYQKQSVLQNLSEKEEEQTNILQLKQVINDKDVEIESLITNIEMRKQQISQLEKIILTLEDVSRNGAAQKRNDQDKIHTLEKKLANLEYHIASKNNDFQKSSENIDNLIKILENELEIPLQSQFITINQAYDTKINENVCCNDDNHNVRNHGEYYNLKNKPMPTKIVMGNFVKKTYIPSNDDKHDSDNHLNRKQAITNIDTQTWTPAPDTENKFALPSSLTDDHHLVYLSGKKTPRPRDKFVKDLQYTLSRNEKNCKMMKLASHRIA